MKTKICTKCNKEKELIEFRKGGSKDGYKSQCKECCKIKDKEYRENNKEKIKKASKKYDDANRELLNIKQRQRYQQNKKEYIKRSVRIHKQKYNEDYFYATKHKLRTRLQSAFRVSKWYKKNNTHELLGCSYECAMNHIESQFIKGMSWDNRDKWHIDHIIPLASAKTEEELIKLCHYTNLQPLWAKDNLKKGSKIKNNCF